MGSSLPPPLRSDATDRLPLHIVRDASAEEPADEPAPGPGRPRTPRAFAGAVKRRARSEARTRFHQIARRTVEAGGLPGVRDEAAAARAEIAELREEIAALYDEFRPLSLELRLGRREVRSDVEANRINLELLKGEVRSFEHVVEELGMAFAPATGVAGAGARFAELREAVYGLERRLRNLTISPPAAGPAPAESPPADAPADAVPAPADTAPTSNLFNYVGFERRFRGDPDQVVAELDERYGALLSEHQPVVDIGCGRAELLERLAQRGVDVTGVDPDPGMVAEGRARGVTVHEAYVGDYLRSVPDHSLGSVISTHVVEHLPLDILIEMLELAVRKLKPGGLFIAETPNPASLIVLGNSYILDPTHVMPLHPALLSFLCETAGYRDVRLQFYSPAEGYHLPHVSAPEEPAWAAELASGVNTAFDRVNEVVFGPQEYAVIATSPPDPDADGS